MNDKGIGIIVGIVVFGIVIIILIKGLKWIASLFKGPVSEQEALQAHINWKAGQQPDGPGDGLRYKKKGSLSWIIWLIVVCGLAYLLISGGILDNLLK